MGKKCRNLAFGWSCVAVLAVAGPMWWPSPAWAQAQAQATGAQTAPNAAADTGTLQEVVVTAEKRATDIQTTPISIEATSGAQLEDQNFTHVQSLQLSTPSLQFNDDGLYQAPSIRGLGTAFSPSLPLGVALIEDGLFIPDQNGFADPFYDVADVETLRGPQGTFVGFSSTAGAIEISTANPNFRGFNGYVEGQLGNYSDKRFDSATNFVLVPNVLAVRLSLNYEQRHSFYRDEGSLIIRGDAEPIQDPGAVDDKDARIGVLWQPTQNFKALMKLQWTSDDSGGTPASINQAPFTLPRGAPNVCPTGTPGPVCYTTYYADGSHLPFILNYTAQNGILPALGMPYWNYRDTLQTDYTFADGIDFRAVTAWSQLQYNVLNDGCSCNLPVSGASYQWIPKQKYYEEQANLISPTDGPFYSKFNWIVGGTWFYKDTGVTSGSATETAPYSVATPRYSFSNTDTVYRLEGFFGQISWQMLPALQLQVGARSNWDNTAIRGTINQTETPGRIAPTAPSTGCVETQAPATGYVCSTPNMYGENTDNVPTGKIDLNWTPLNGQFFYVFYARGYKGEGVNAQGTAQKPLPPTKILPEYVNDWELGWNGRLFNNHMTTHLGGYWMVDQNSQQAGIFFPLTGGTIVGNLGSETLKGIEATMNGRFGGFGVNLDAAYEKTKLTGITNVATYALPPNAAGGQCGYPGVNPLDCFNYTPYQVSVSGEVDPHAPELQGSLSFDYLLHVGRGTLDPKISYYYTGKQYAALFEIPFYEEGPRHIWNASLTYDAGTWDMEAYFDNFTNEAYLSGIMGSQVFYGAPYQYGLRIKKSFEY